MLYLTSQILITLQPSGAGPGFFLFCLARSSDTHGPQITTAPMRQTQGQHGRAIFRMEKAEGRDTEVIVARGVGEIGKGHSGW